MIPFFCLQGIKSVYRVWMNKIVGMGLSKTLSVQICTLHRRRPRPRRRHSRCLCLKRNAPFCVNVINADTTRNLTICCGFKL